MAARRPRQPATTRSTSTAAKIAHTPSATYCCQAPDGPPRRGPRAHEEPRHDAQRERGEAQRHAAVARVRRAPPAAAAAGTPRRGASLHLPLLQQVPVGQREGHGEGRRAHEHAADVHASSAPPEGPRRASTAARDASSASSARRRDEGPDAASATPLRRTAKGPPTTSSASVESPSRRPRRARGPPNQRARRGEVQPRRAEAQQPRPDLAEAPSPPRARCASSATEAASIRTAAARKSAVAARASGGGLATSRC
jgi:hypothetical protein